MIISFFLQAADTVVKVISSTFGPLDYPNLLFCVISLTREVHFITGNNIFWCCQKIKGTQVTGPHLYKVENYETKCYTEYHSFSKWTEATKGLISTYKKATWNMQT